MSSKYLQNSYPSKISTSIMFICIVDILYIFKLYKFAWSSSTVSYLYEQVCFPDDEGYQKCVFMIGLSFTIFMVSFLSFNSYKRYRLYPSTNAYTFTNVLEIFFIILLRLLNKFQFWQLNWTLNTKQQYLFRRNIFNHSLF